MARKFFGTDGIRGRANAGVLTAELAMKVGQAAGTRFLRGEHKHRVIIGIRRRASLMTPSMSARYLENVSSTMFSVGI